MRGSELGIELTIRVRVEGLDIGFINVNFRFVDASACRMTV